MYKRQGDSNEIEVQMYCRVPHLLPPTITVGAGGYAVILMSRAEFTLDALLAGPMTNAEIIPLLSSLCEYLRKLTEQAFTYKLHIKDFSPRNVAFFPAGGLSPPQGGGVSPPGWACCDFGNWAVLPLSSWRDASNARGDVLKRLENSDYWARRRDLFAWLNEWLVGRLCEHAAEQAAAYLRSVVQTD